MRSVAIAVLLTTLAAAAANAVPRPHITRLDRGASASIATSRIGLVCNERGCWRAARRFSWYRPYGYYRPYRGDPRAALGDWTFGVGRYGAGTYYDADPRYRDF